MSQRKTVPKKTSDVQPGIDLFYQYKKAVNDLEQSFAKDFVGWLD